MTATAQGRRAMAGPLRLPAFRYQFAARAVSVAGSTLSPVALAFGVLEVTRSAVDLSLVLAASTAPTVAFLLVGGVWADRLPRHRLMLSANLVCTVTQAAMGAMLLTGHLVLWLAMLLQFVTGTAMAFYFPAVNGLTAQTVPGSLLQQANALLSLTKSLAGTVGPLAASVLVVTVGAGWALVADGAAFLLSAVLLSRIRAPEAAPPPAGGDRRFVRELGAGFREVTSRDWVWTSIIAFMVGHLGTAFFLVLGPTVLLERGDPAIVWGGTIAVLSIGQLAGDVIALRFVPRRPILACRVIELLTVPVLVALAWGAPSWLLFLTALPAGIALTVADTLWYTALQRHLPAQTLSRVSSYDWMGSFALRPVGYVAAAALAGAVGATWTLLFAAVLSVLVRCAGLFFPGVRRLPSTGAAEPDDAPGPQPHHAARLDRGRRRAPARPAWYASRQVAATVPGAAVAVRRHRSRGRR